MCVGGDFFFFTCKSNTKVQKHPYPVKRFLEHRKKSIFKKRIIIQIKSLANFLFNRWNPSR